MNCTICNSQMKPLFTSYFCPNDCDKPSPVASNGNGYVFLFGKNYQPGYVYETIVGIALMPTKERALNHYNKFFFKNSSMGLYYAKIIEYKNSEFYGCKIAKKLVVIEKVMS